MTDVCVLVIGWMWHCCVTQLLSVCIAVSWEVMCVCRSKAAFSAGNCETGTGRCICVYVEVKSVCVCVCVCVCMRVRVCLLGCRCEAAFSTGNCETGTGRCICRPEYAGVNCDRSHTHLCNLAHLAAESKHGRLYVLLLFLILIIKKIKYLIPMSPII